MHWSTIPTEPSIHLRIVSTWRGLAGALLSMEHAMDLQSMDLHSGELSSSSSLLSSTSF